MPGAEDRAVAKLEADGAAAVTVAAFRRRLRGLHAPDAGLLAGDELEPLGELPALDDLPVPSPAAAREVLDRVVVLKLNGGLGTSMGMSGPKSLLRAKGEDTFLDLIARQVLALRERSGARVPLVLMSSFATREASLAELPGGLEADLDRDFLQSKEPKVLVDGLGPATWPASPALEWCPPGHGDLFTALQTSGLLARMLARGYRYAFVSSSDNLAAVLDPRILAWTAAQGAPFVMEVADRTAADRKGGHVAIDRKGGGLLLREVAQCPDEDLDSFQDVARHRYFNTNTIWLDLPAVAAALERRGGVLGLPLIRNRKTLDPADSDSPEVFQIETAMGAALGVVDGARALRVPRSRFTPVKTTADLLALRSDAYEIAGDGSVVLAAGRAGRPPLVDLDDEHYRLVGDFEARVEEPPSLRGCERLVVRGDVVFGPGVVVRGDVEIEAPHGAVRLEDTVLEG
jgi:UTP--glucose-1-phosphate uridylyltransferase